MLKLVIVRRYLYLYMFLLLVYLFKAYIYIYVYFFFVFHSLFNVYGNGVNTIVSFIYLVFVNIKSRLT